MDGKLKFWKGIRCICTWRRQWRRRRLWYKSNQIV